MPAKPLAVLDLSATKVTDAGLKELIAFKKLTTLDLGFTSVTDTGMKELAGLKNLDSPFASPHLGGGIGIEGSKVLQIPFLAAPP